MNRFRTKATTNNNDRVVSNPNALVGVGYKVVTPGRARAKLPLAMSTPLSHFFIPPTLLHLMRHALYFAKVIYL